jgi:hypothetical protein
MAEQDPAIARLVEEGYEFVTNAFRPGKVPAGIRGQEAPAVVRRLEKEGFVAAQGEAYDEHGAPRAEMASVWRRPRP